MSTTEKQESSGSGSKIRVRISRPLPEGDPIMGQEICDAWRKAICEMTFNQLVQVECKIQPGDNNWKKIFLSRPGFVKENVKCVLCDTAPLSKMTTIRQHISGKRHQRKFEVSVKDARHPSINPAKNLKKTPSIEVEKPSQTQNESKIVVNPVSLQKQKEVKEKEATNQTKDKDVSEDDLKKFRERLSKLEASDLLLVEYKFVNTDWRNLFRPEEGVIDKNSVSCAMCKSATFSLAGIKAHMDNRQHKRNIELVRALHHPKLFPVKNASTEDPKASQPDKIANTTESNVNNKQNSNNQLEIKKVISPSSTRKLQDAGKKEKISENKAPVKGNNEQSKIKEVKNQNTEILNQCKAEKMDVNIPTTMDDESTRKGDENTSSEPVINPSNVKKLTVEATTTGKNLKELMKTLEVIDLLEIEFYFKGPNSAWKKMFTQFPDTSFKCFLCGTFLIKNLKDLRTHIVSVRHQTSINATEKLFHPTLAPTKFPSEIEKSQEAKETHKPKETNNEKQQNAPEEKLDDKKFRERLVTLTFDDLKKVEYLMNGKWAPLMSSHGKFVMCNLCDVTGISSYRTYIAHLSGKRHTEQQSNIEKLFHPVFTYAKDHTQASNKTFEGSTVKKTVERMNSDIICTITVEDSPEREIPTKAKNKDTEKRVVNPASIIAKSNEKKQQQQQPQQPQKSQQQFQRKENNFVQTQNQHKDPYNLNPSAQMFRGNRTFQGGQNFVPNQFQGEKIITPRVTPFSSTPSTNLHPTFSKKNLTSTKVEEVEGLIGVEYVVKILHHVNDTTPRFECCLCEIEVDGVGMQFHLKGLLHRKKYIERHFPTAMRRFSKYKDDPKYTNVMYQICEQLAVAIEKYHGRDLPFECLQEEFRSNRDGIMSKVFSFRHASELTGPSFTNIVDEKMIDDFIANHNYKPPQPETKRKPTFDVDKNAPPPNIFEAPQQRNAPTLGVEEHRVLVEKFLQNTNLNSGSSSTRKHRTRSRSRSPRRIRSRSPRNRQTRKRSPRKRSHERKSPGDWTLYSHSLKSPVRGAGGDIWDSYRRMFNHGIEDLDKDYKEYKRDPEKHPLYDEEWKKYWTKKSKALRAEGIDPSTFNFQPGWVRFFSRRVHQLYEEGVEDIRVKLRERLGLPRHNNNLHNERYHIGVHRTREPFSDVEDISDASAPEGGASPINERSPERYENYPPSKKMTPDSTSHQSLDPLMKKRDDSFEHAKTSKTRSKSRDDKFDHLKTTSEREKEIKGNSKEQKQQRPKTIIIREYEDLKEAEPELIIKSAPLTTVSVLRLLTALEDQLGSLGPKVIDLLSKALTLEKVKPNSADEILMTEGNCVFLETVNEKLKGQVLAGVIEGAKVKAVKKAIKDLTELLQIANEHFTAAAQQQKEIEKPPKTAAPKRPANSAAGSGPPTKSPCLDKQEIATKLAAALSAQGKTDFSSQQLEQLVAVYTLIEKKQRENAATSKSSGASENTTSEQQKKSLSETLLDFLKPSASAGNNMQQQSSTPNTNQPMSLYSRDTSSTFGNNYSRDYTPRTQNSSDYSHAMHRNAGRNSLSSSSAGGNLLSNPITNSSSQQRPQQPSSFSSRSYNFSLSNFDTSLKLPSTNLMTNQQGTYSNSSNPLNQAINSIALNQNLANMIQGIVSRGQNSPNVNSGQVSSSSNSNLLQSNQFGFNQSSAMNQNQSPQIWSNQHSIRHQQQQQQTFNSNNDYDGVLTSTSYANRGGNNNSSMITYPSNNPRGNQYGNNSEDNFRGGNRSQAAPMGWQRGNSRRR